MKNLIILLLLTLGVSSYGQQFFINITDQSLQEHADKYDMKIDRDVYDSGNTYTVVYDDELVILCIYDPTDEVNGNLSFSSLICPNSSGMFSSILEKINAQCIELAGNEWVTYHDWGVIRIKLITEEGKRYPYFHAEREVY